MWSNVAYFSTWRTHGNRVSKTRFPTYTYQRKTHLEHIREEPREGRKKKKSEQREKNPDQRKERKNLEKAHSSPHQHGLGLAWPGLARRNRSPVTQVAGDPGHAAWVVRLGLSGLGRKRPRLREPRLATGNLGRAPGLARLGSQASPGARQATSF